MLEDPSSLPISLSPPEQQDTEGTTPYISLTDEGASAGLPPKVTEDRASMAHVAMGEDSPGMDSLIQGLDKGLEGMMRAQYAANKDLQKKQDHLDFIKKLSSLEGKPNDPKLSEAAIQSYITEAITQKAEVPDTVWEKSAANAYVKHVALSDPENNKTYKYAFDVDAPSTLQAMEWGANTVARKNVGLTILQNLESRWEDLPNFIPDKGSFVNKTDAYLSQFIPFLSWARMHDVIKGAGPTESFLPGSNLEDQVRNLWMLPPDKFHAALKNATEELWNKNPLDAIKLAQAATAYGSSERLLGDIFGMVDLGTVVPVGWIGKGLKGFLTKGSSRKLTGELKSEGHLPTGEEFKRTTDQPRDNGGLSTGDQGSVSLLREADPNYVQLELFSKGDRTQRELFENLADQTAPTLESKLPPGKLRATHETEATKKPLGNLTRSPITGRWERTNQTQLELPLPPGEHQPSFDLRPRIPAGEDLRLWAQKTLTEAENLPASRVEFQTAKGSRYVVEADGTTTRNKAARPEHPGEVGPQPTSQKTYYVTPEDAQKLGEFQTQGSKKSVTELNGQIGVKYLDGKDAGKFEKRTMVTPQTEPREGLIPVEVWKDGQRVHFGNPITKVTTGAADATLNLAKQALKGAVKATEGRTTEVENVLAKTGNLEQATTMVAMKALKTIVGTLDPNRSSEPLQKMLASIFNPDRFWQDMAAHARDGGRELAQDALNRSVQLLNALMNPARVNRLAPDAELKAVELAKEAGKYEFRPNSDSILDIVSNGRSRVDNINTISVHLGTPQKTRFESPERALHWAREQYKLSEGDYFIAQEGKEYYINVVRPVNETLDQVRDVVIGLKNTPHETGILGQLKAMIGKYRSAADTQSDFQQQQRVLATHAPQAMKKLIQDHALIMSKELSGQEYKDLERILIQNRDMKGVDGERGMFYQTRGDLDKAYLAMHKRLPSDAEAKAYHAYTQLSDFDWALRELNWHREKMRTGIQNHSLILKQEGTSVDTPWFQARKVDDIDWASTAEEGIWMHADGKGKLYFKNRLKSDEEMRHQIKKSVEENNYQILQVFDPMQRPLGAALDNKEIIHYVITDATKNRRLLWGEHSTYRPGGHSIYQQPWYIKQGIIGTGTMGRPSYFGDATLRGGFSTQKEAEKWAARYDTARQLLQSGDEAALEAYLKTNLPESLPEFKKLFTGAGPAGGLSPDHPILVTYTGRNVFETGHPGLKAQYPDLYQQATHPNNLASQMEKQFLADRGRILEKNVQLGTEANPIFKLENAAQLDPFTALEQGLQDVIRNRYLGDYKVSAAENLLNEFHAKGIFDAKEFPLEKIRRNPLYYLHKITTDPKSLAREDINAFETARQQAFNLLGIKKDLDRDVETFELRLMNSVYEKLGSKAADKAQQLLPFIRDPAAYMRAVAFHSRLGFFNPSQLWVQSQSLANVLLIEPKDGAKGFAGYMAFRKIMFSEDEPLLNKTAQFMTKFGWKKDEYIEAVNAMKSTGFHYIAGETGWKDVLDEAKTFQGTANRWLDKGTFFFAEGERSVRGTAFLTSYRNWRRANPTAELDNHALGEVLNRADLLSVNMTRASNASWQKGIATVPTQFMTFNLRLAEQFIGKRLDPGEKMRLLGGYSMLYGVPIALSAPTGFLPFYEDIRKAAMERGVPLNEPFMKALHEGMLSMMVEGITGRNYNIEQRFGPGANNAITEILKGNKGPIDIMGAGPATIRDIVKSTMPMAWYMKQAISGEPGAFNILMEDLAESTKNITTVSNTAKMIYGLNTGKYVTKNDLYAGDVTTMDSILTLALGTTPQHITDAYLKSASLKDQHQLQTEGSKEIIKEMRRGVQSGYAQDYDGMQQHFKRANSLAQGLGLDYSQQADVFKKSTQGYESLVDRVNRDFILKAPLQEKYLRMNGNK